VGWVIPPESNAEFVAAMENVLDVYRRPYDASRPVVCMDETPRQLIGQVHEPIPAKPGQPERQDYEYERLGVCNVFMASEPLAGRRITKVTERKTKIDWAHFLRDIAEQYPAAGRITLVMDNLNTHTPASLYEAFSPEQAKALWDRFEFVYTPKHGSWLNMAEIELNVMIAQCLNRRIDHIDTVRSEVAAWQASRDQLNAKIDWQFTTDHARIKLKRLYPTEVT
jgi:transposase